MSASFSKSSSILPSSNLVIPTGEDRSLANDLRSGGICRFLPLAMFRPAGLAQYSPVPSAYAPALCYAGPPRRTVHLRIPRIAPCHICSMKQPTGRLMSDFLGFLDRWPHTGSGNIVMAITAVFNTQHKSAGNEALYRELKKLATILRRACNQNF